MAIGIEIIGWWGMVLIFLAYTLVSTKKVEGKSVLYQVINLIGAIALIVNCFHHRTFPVMILNVLWAIVAIQALISGRRR